MKPTPDFSSYSEQQKLGQPVPEHSELVEDSSRFWTSWLVYDDSIPEVPQKQDEAIILVKENLIEISSESMTGHENSGKTKACQLPPPEGGNRILESFQPSLGITKDTLAPWWSFSIESG